MKFFPFLRHWVVRQMFFKLAFRNVKRQLRNYLIYFLTVVLTVAILFAINNVIFSKTLTEFIQKMSDMKTALIGIVVLISGVVAFVLKYATSFMLRLRKREFGTYLTLGMTRKNILIIFIFETTLICLVALGFGLLLGLFLYQGLMAIILNLLEITFTVAPYAMDGLVFTIGLVLGIFLLSSIASAFYLKKVSIYDLIHGDKKVEKKIKYPLLWFIVAILSLALMIGCCVVFKIETDKIILQGLNATTMMYSLLVFAVTVITFYIGLTRSVVHVLLKRKRKHTGTKTFVLRQLSSTMKSNSLMFGLLAFLMTFAVIAANVSFVNRISEEKTLTQSLPFDILYVNDLDDNNTKRIPLEEGERIMEEYVEIEKKIPYTLYSSRRQDFHRLINAGSITDSFMSQTMFNTLANHLGLESVKLNNEFQIISNLKELEKVKWADTTFNWNDITYRFKDIKTDYPKFCYMYFFVVVPDQALKNMVEEINYVAYDIGNQKFDAVGLREALSYKYNTYNSRTDFQIREYHRITQNSMSTFLIVGALFIAITFLFMAMAILSLKTLSTLEDDKKRYLILFRLGVGPKEQNKTLFFQTFIFFLTPFIIPLLCNIPVIILCNHIMDVSGFSSLIWQVTLTAALIIFVMIVIYTLYYIATYLIAKKAIIQNETI